MRKLHFILFGLLSFHLMAQSQVRGTIVDQSNKPVSYVTIAFQSQTISSRLEGVFSDGSGNFKIQLPPDRYLITFQMVGYENLEIEKLITSDVDLGRIILAEHINELEEVVVRAERSYIENDLGKKILHVGSDLANAGNTAVDALESLPSVTTTINGNINVRGSENVIIYVNGRETKRDPKSLQFISADALQKIELITNPSAKYDAQGVAGIINLVYTKSKSTKLDVFSSLAMPFRGSAGINTSISSDKFTLNVNASERRSLFEIKEDQDRLTPEDSLRRYENLILSNGDGLTREINLGLSYEPDTSFMIGFEMNYLRWVDDAEQIQTGSFVYENESQDVINLSNDEIEIEDEISLTFLAERKFKGEHSLKLLFATEGENETNRSNFNRENVDISNTPIQQSIRSSNETEDQRYYQAKLDYSKPIFKDVNLELGTAIDVFDVNVDQKLSFFESDAIDNRFKIEMEKYAGYLIVENKRNRFEYALGIRYEQFASTSLQRSIDSTFTQQFNNLFPSAQWMYAIGEKDHTLGFNFTRRINRPAFHEVSPFLSYIDPLNLETGNPFLRPEFGYLYDLTYSGSWGKLSFDITGFRRTTQDVIQQVTQPLSEDRLLVSFDNLGTRNDDGLEWNAVFDLSQVITLETSGSAYRTQFKSENQSVFFNGRWNWKSRLKQRFRLGNDWTIDLTQYYRAPRFGAQSISRRQYYVHASVQKSFNEKRGNITLSLRDVFNTRIFASEVRGEDFSLVNNYKYQTQALILSFRYKVLE